MERCLILSKVDSQLLNRLQTSSLTQLKPSISLAPSSRRLVKIQQMPAPANIDTAPGLKIEVAFYPMREVGGDFYLADDLT